MIAELEKSIEEILQATFRDKGPVVASGVDDVSAYQNLSARGMIIIRYGGATYVRNGNYMTRNWRFTIVVGTKKFSQHGSSAGAYDVIDKIRSVLTGRGIKPKDSSGPPIKLLPEIERFVMENKGVWWFEITFTGTDALMVPIR